MNLQDKRLIIFDVDGTLLNTIDTIAFHGNRALRELGFDEMDVSDFMRFVGNSSLALVQRLLEKQGVYDPKEVKKVMDLYHKYYQKDVTYLTHPYDGILDLVKDLSKRGYIVTAISNKPDHTLRIVIDEMEIADLFDFSQGQMDDIEKKPSAQMVNILLEKFGVRKEDACIIGDSEVDIQTGKNADIKTVAVSWGFRSEEELRSLDPDWLVHEVDELRALFDKEVIL
ncbi:MAG: HAD-IA family hydrolase [Tissierellia bacterium]|nr:HAD-IA family hydrolase [Tissierellia bacterium]